jgi:hypothetical protein
MKSIEDISAFLETMQSRPAMFWGSSEQPFTSLVAFLAGYKLGAGAGPGSQITHGKLVPKDFSEFVAQRLAIGSAPGGKGWAALIREHTSSENEAFDLFFRLRREYEDRISSNG